MKNHELVSVCVVTYNSAKTIIETLNSIREQSYLYIELIVSDDCSTDDTFDICRRWMEQNAKRFIDCKVVKTPSNKGVSGNFNNAIRHSSGKWVRLIAGDDIMLPHCVQYYVDNLALHPSISVFLSRVNSFSDNSNGERLFYALSQDDEVINSFNCMSASEQCNHLLDDGGDFLCAPTSFIDRELMLELPYNETYRFMEDFPQWVKLTDRGHKIYIFNEVTVLYRKANSVSRNRNNFFQSRLMETKKCYFWSEKIGLHRKYGTAKGYNADRKMFLSTELVETLTGNRRTVFNTIVVKMIQCFISVLKFEIKI